MTKGSSTRPTRTSRSSSSRSPTTRGKSGSAIAITGNAKGFLYNKAVFEQAGVTDLPTTPEEFVAALQAIADETDAIPLYTNYAPVGPMTQWEIVSAGVMVTALPTLVVFLALPRCIYNGFTSGATR